MKLTPLIPEITLFDPEKKKIPASGRVNTTGNEGSFPESTSKSELKKPHICSCQLVDLGLYHAWEISWLLEFHYRSRTNREETSTIEFSLQFVTLLKTKPDTAEIVTCARTGKFFISASFRRLCLRAYMKGYCMRAKMALVCFLGIPRVKYSDFT